MVNNPNENQEQSAINIAKNYLINLPSKQQFEEIMKQVRLTPLEHDIIIWRYKDFKSVINISIDAAVSTATIYHKQRSALDKIYRFLVYKKYI